MRAKLEEATGELTKLLLFDENHNLSIPDEVKAFKEANAKKAKAVVEVLGRCNAIAKRLGKSEHDTSELEGIAKELVRLAESGFEATW